MAKSSSEILREYAKIIAEADWKDDATGIRGEDNEPVVHPNDDNFIDLPDDSLMDDDDNTDDDEFKTWDKIPETDPIINLSRALHVDSDKIEKWLNANKYELTPINGLSNSEGKI